MSVNVSYHMGEKKVRAQELTIEELEELVDRLIHRPTHVTAMDKMIIGNYLRETLLLEKKDAISSDNKPETL